MSSRPIEDVISARFGTGHVFATHNKRAFDWLHEQSKKASNSDLKFEYLTAGSMIGHHNRTYRDCTLGGYDREAKKIVELQTGQEIDGLTRAQWEEYFENPMKELYINPATASNERSTMGILYGLCTDAFKATAPVSTLDPSIDKSTVAYSTQHGGEAFIIEVLKRDSVQRDAYEERTLNVMGWKMRDDHLNSIDDNGVEGFQFSDMSN